MVRKVKRIELEPLPKPRVVYIPDTQTLYIENGRTRADAEEMADGVLVYYDRDDGASAVALNIEQAEVVLKPFVDAILAKYGFNPVQTTATHETSD